MNCSHWLWHRVVSRHHPPIKWGRALLPITLGLKESVSRECRTAVWNSVYSPTTNYMMKLSVLWASVYLLYSEGFELEALQGLWLQLQEMEDCFLSQRPFVVEFLDADPPGPMHTQSLEISILWTLTCAVTDASVLCVLIKCYYLPLCPEAMCWEWARFHKSGPGFYVGSSLILLVMSL